MSSSPAGMARSLSSRLRTAALARVVAGLADAHRDREHPNSDRNRGADARPKAWVRPGGQEQHRGRHEAADQVGRRPTCRAEVEEVVVDDVERRDAEGNTRKTDFGEEGCRGGGSPPRLVAG